MNANGVFNAHGELTPSWHPFACALAAHGCGIALLTEPHLQDGSSLPVDSPLALRAAPAPGARVGRRDAAIAVDPRSDWTALQSPSADIAGVSLTLGQGAPPVRMTAAYVPDSSRGCVARAAFFDRLDATLQRWASAEPGAIQVLGIDANTWDPDLDPNRAASADLPRLRALLVNHGLSVVNPAGVRTHRSGTVIDWVATSHPALLSNVHVHSVACEGACGLWPACYPALGSDHALITFDLLVQPRPQPITLAQPRLLCCDWVAALGAARDSIASLAASVSECPVIVSPSARQVALDAIVCRTFEAVWAAAEAQGALKLGARGAPRRGCRWWTAECQRTWRLRQQAHAVFRANPSPCNREAHRLARNTFAHTVARAQRDGWSQLLGEVESSAILGGRLAARIVRDECGRHARGPPPCMQRGGAVLNEDETLRAWSEHFSSVAPEPRPPWADTLEQIVASWRQRPIPQVSPATVDELRAAAAGAAANLRSAPGPDGLPYAPFLAQAPAWEDYLCSLFTLVMQWGMAPRCWTLGVVTPLAKEGSPVVFDNWRPITLLSCLGKLFEHVLLRRVAPALLPTLACTQAGFRFGADEQAFALIECLRARLATARRRSRRPLVAFLDIRKAFDVVWRDALLWKLRLKQLRGAEWHAIAALLAPTFAYARLPRGNSPPWHAAHGVRQGSVLSPLLFLVFIDDLAQALLRIPGVTLPGYSLAALLYADDLALLAETPAALQAALDIAGAWAARWRMSFGRGPTKTAVMQVSPRGPASGDSPFTLSGQTLPWVSTYRYLGVVVDRGLTLRQHVAERGERGRAAFFGCCGWAQRERLSLPYLARLVETYVVPKVLWGMELAAFSPVRMRELDAWQRRIGRWLLRDFRAPDAVVLGDLGWRPWSSLAQERAAALWCRLQPPRPARPSAEVAAVSATLPTGWAQLVTQSLQAVGAPPPGPSVRAEGCPVRHDYIHSRVRPRLAERDLHQWRARLAAYTDSGLRLYAALATVPAVPAVHRAPCPPRHASAWCRMRHGGSTLPSHRAARHRGATTCPLCLLAAPDLAHAILHCPGLAAPRAQWRARTGHVAPARESDDSVQLRWFFAGDATAAVASANAAFAFCIECALGDARQLR